MKQKKDDFKEMFRDRLGETGLTVRDGFWEELEKEIPSRRFFMANFNPIRFAAAAAILLLLVGTYAAFLFLSPQKDMEEAFQQVALAPIAKDVIHNDRVAEDFSPAVAVPVKPGYSRIVPAVEATEETDSVSFNFSFSFSVTMDDSSTTSGSDDYWYSFAGNGEAAMDNNDQDPGFVTAEGGKKRTAGSGWSVKVTANAFSPAYSSGFSGARMFTKSNSSLNVVKEWDGNYVGADEFGSAAAYEKYRGVVEANHGKGEQTKVKHKLPVSVGLLAHKQLGDWFGLETGLIYTHLRSELSYGEGTYYTQDQKLHYLGIPLRATAKVLEKDQWSLYATAGGIMEKCIAGKTRTKFFEETMPVLNEEGSISTGRLNYSLTAAAGVEYKLNDHLALYAEPGLSYSFDDNGTLSTIRKDKPLNFNLQCGVRIQY